MPNCGSPVTVDRVMVVDLSAEEGMDGPVIADAEPYRLISDTAVAVKSTGSRVRTIRSATRLAARNGCDLLIIGPFEESRSPIHSAPASNRGGSSTLKRFLMVHMGVRQGEPDL
ncbi:MAG: hypothetical protein GWM87_02420 [Xanthomonadales bacterium]|nr:hypothetical protein [Xanthomonadales bacterium]NIX11918.1 hypothetical protein [Xanthomonadales bacterium]